MDDDLKRRIVAEAMRNAEGKYHTETNRKTNAKKRSLNREKDKAPNKTPKTKKRNSGAARSKAILIKIERDAKIEEEKEIEKEIDEFLSKLNKSIQSSSELRELWGIDDDSFRYNRKNVYNYFHVYYIWLTRNMQNGKYTLLFYNPKAARQFFEVRVKIKNAWDVEPTIRLKGNETSIFIEQAYEIEGSESKIEKYCYDDYTSRAETFPFKTEERYIDVELVLNPYLHEDDSDSKHGCEISIYWPLNRDRVENARDNAAKLEEQFGEAAQNVNTSSNPEQE